MVFLPSFFHKDWHIVGGDDIEAVLSMLNLGYLLNKVNFTHILLIPKKEPQSMSDYRPISLSNVVSRIVSKVLANRIKTILPNVIFDSQSAFVTNRLILDNNYVAYEILYRLRNRRQGKIGYMTVKLDIRKIMQKLGFIDGWVNLAMQCVTSAIYTILINGEPRSFISPSLGIKQGDPLSPYLFLFYVEGLSALLHKAIET